MTRPCFFFLFLLSFLAQPLFAKAVHYDLTATRGTVNVSGKRTVDFALLVNGGIPAPTLEFTDGDDAEITMKNEIPDEEISIHWHGILLPPEMDGVPYVNNRPIRPGESFTFKFKLRQSGTYWYHTHTNVQEQKGIYGGIIIHPKKKTIPADRDLVVVLSDWADEDAKKILANLRKDGDYYLYKKGTVRSWAGAIEAGRLGVFLDNEWTRMGGMDFSDVGYDAFLINGRRELQLADARAGETLRIRLINASASTYFLISLGQMPMRVISSDGVDLRPTDTKEIQIGMAETYDILFQVPENKNFELRATAQDGTGAASAWIGRPGGEKVAAPVKPMPDMYAPMEHGGHEGMDHGGHEGMDHGGHEGMDHGAPAPAEDHSKMDHSKMDHGTPAPAEDHSKMDHSKMDHSKMDHSGHADHSTAGPVIETFTVDAMEALESTDFKSQKPTHDVTLELDGDMSRYVWYINGKAMFEERTILINEGDIVRFRFVNKTMMHHPMHLHGHFFRVLNDKGSKSPWKHTVDVPPHMTREIEFRADEKGEWMLHCHNLYHMKNGMARVVKYSSYNPSPEIQELQKHDPHLHDHTYFYGMLEAATNHAQGKFRLIQTWNEIEARFETRRDYSWEGEGDLVYRRWFGKYTTLVAGVTNFERETLGMAGVGYILPGLIHSNLYVTSNGKLRLDLEKEFQWTSTIFSDFDIAIRQGHKTEWEFSLMYAESWPLAAGFKFTGETVGFGAQYQF